MDFEKAGPGRFFALKNFALKEKTLNFSATQGFALKNFRTQKPTGISADLKTRRGERKKLTR